MSPKEIAKARVINLRDQYRLKAKASFAFFLKFCWIEDKEKKQAMPFKLWESQLRILPKILYAPLLVIIKARQLGLTWICAAYCLWFVSFHSMKLVVVMSAKGDWAVEFLDRVYFMLQKLPAWLYAPATVDKDNSETLVINHTVNGMLLPSTIKSLATTESGAQSKTPDLLILDESCWNRYVKQIYSASKPGIDAAGGRIIVISNSIKHAPGWGWTRRLVSDAIKKLNGFEWLFMPWQDRPGRGETFRQDLINGGEDPEDVIDHYPETVEEALAAKTGSYFGHVLTRHYAYIEQAKPAGVVGNLHRDLNGEVQFVQDSRGILEVWRWPYHMTEGWDEVPWTKRYCIGSDVSEGVGRSYSVGYVKDRLKDESVARVRANRIDAHRWADYLYLLSEFYCHTQEAKEWFRPERATICVEITGAGQTTVRALKDKKGVNLYIQMVPAKVGSELVPRYGWHESDQAKQDLSEDLRRYFRITKGRVYCPILLDECSTWILTEGGRIGKIGPEDEQALGDCVIAAGLTEQASIFMGGSPKMIKRPIEGWRKEYLYKEASNWAV